MKKIIHSLPISTYFITAATRITEMIDHEPAIDTEDKKGKARSYVRGEIQFKGVYFNYPSRPHPARARPHGEILLDGYKINKLHLKWLRSQMGLVNQEPVLFATSIKENILFGEEGALMEDVEKAAVAANAHDFIVKLLDAYETQVGQFGVQLSGGQKQRIAIERALIRNPKILLLDEATSALDTESERLVQMAIKQASKGRTAIVVAHRISTIRMATLITVLNSGRVVEFGSHDELMQINGGHYANMVELQLSALASGDNGGFYTPRGKNHLRAMIPSSPISVVSSPRTPSMKPISPFSMSAPYSIQYEAAYDSDDDYAQNSTYTAPSQLRLLKLNEPEPEKSNFTPHARIYSYIFLGLGFFNFFTNLIQHYNFAIMGERLTKRVREMLLTLEIRWFDQDENTSAAISMRLSIEVNLVKSLVGDRMSLQSLTVFGATFAYILGLVLTWRLALVMMVAQPLLIGSFYARSVLTKTMSQKTQTAQKEESQLASEAVINHRTITAFSSQKRNVCLFRATLDGLPELAFAPPSFSGSNFNRFSLLVRREAAVTT
ncbi:hypothetical protein SASPL_152586 [Salvia splendens]|uniref:ATP-binding cassette, subfamily B (MDR/TAP), member 1 n=1 Tax=Salvia splendens TaxID=180675 RepID=A0A8X8W3X0_SALSN|nr:hypothetical protein SASPL_152586 [Salvia splendens]